MLCRLSDETWCRMLTQFLEMVIQLPDLSIQPGPAIRQAFEC